MFKTWTASEEDPEALARTVLEAVGAADDPSVGHREQRRSEIKRSRLLSNPSTVVEAALVYRALSQKRREITSKLEIGLGASGLCVARNEHRDRRHAVR